VIPDKEQKGEEEDGEREACLAEVHFQNRPNPKVNRSGLLFFNNNKMGIFDTVLVITVLGLLTRPWSLDGP